MKIRIGGPARPPRFRGPANNNVSLGNARLRTLRADDLSDEVTARRAEDRIAGAMATPFGAARARSILGRLRRRRFGRDALP